MANQTAIPYIQTEPDLNQVQQNVNKVFRNMNNKVVALEDSVERLEIVGEVKLSTLTLAQFQQEAGSTWIESNGQSCVNTAYSKLTGNNLTPVVSVVGVNAYIKVNP